MSLIVSALGPFGFRTYAFDPDDWSLVPAEGTSERWLVPGFVDIHIHGAFGIDFMDTDADGLRKLADGLTEVGYDAFLPTTVAASADDVKWALSVLTDSDPRIPGFHLEGPFLSPKYPGAQPPQAICLPPSGPSPWDSILEDPRLRVVTMAPELEGAGEWITRLTRRGVKVSMGHTNATFEECRAGFKAGVAHATHTYNAMRPLHHREAGVVGFALAEDELKCELIYDRLHVSPPAAALLVKCKPADGIIAISDSTKATGLPAGQRLSMWNLTVEVGVQQVRLLDGTLAGSGITLLDAFRNLAVDFGLELAIRACAWNPRVALGWDPLEPRTYLEMSLQGEILRRHERPAR